MDVFDRTGVALNWGFGILGAVMCTLGVILVYVSVLRYLASGHRHHVSDGVLYSMLVLVGVIFLTARWILFG